MLAHIYSVHAISIQFSPLGKGAYFGIGAAPPMRRLNLYQLPDVPRQFFASPRRPPATVGRGANVSLSGNDFRAGQPVRRHQYNS